MYQKKLSTFLQKKSLKPKIIVIFGPTASGKTSLSIEIAKILATEIISTDSRQIFKGMDIGTGKITEEEKQGIPHYMIDIISPNQNYSVADFKGEAEQYIKKIHDIGKIPVLVGGTGLYIDALIYENQIGNMPSDPHIRKKIELLSDEALYLTLQQEDPEYARELHPNNRPYLERALEIKWITGKSKKDFRQDKILKYDTLFVTPIPEYIADAPKDFGFLKTPEYRKWIYERIDTRVKKMFGENLLGEIITLKNTYSFEDFGMKSIGYYEFQSYFDTSISIQEVEKLVAQHSRNYAKRQITWFGKYKNEVF